MTQEFSGRKGGTRFRAALVLVLLSGLIYAVRGFHNEKLLFQSLDFKTVYGGARCLMDGCDPYNSQDIYAAYLRGGGPPGDSRPFRPHESVYLPPALGLVVPFALLPWGPAHLVWLLLSTGLFVLSAVLVLRLCLPLAPIASAVGIGFLLMISTMLITLAQPAQVTIATCAIGVWCVLENRYRIAGVLCLAIALVLKPHVTGLVWVYLLLSPGLYRKQAVRAMVVAALLSIPSLIWVSTMPASSHWMTELPANLRQLELPGKVNDPGPRNPEVRALTDVQAVVSLFRDEPSFYNRIGLGLGVILFAIWLVPVLRMRPSRERDYFALASIVCISLLPVYHREYDTRIFLLTFPAAGLLWTRGRTAWWTTAVVMGAAVVAVSPQWQNFVLYRLVPRIESRTGTFGLWGTVFWERQLPILGVMLSIFFLGWFYAAMRSHLRWAARREERRTRKALVTTV